MAVALLALEWQSLRNALKIRIQLLRSVINLHFSINLGRVVKTRMSVLTIGTTALILRLRAQVVAEPKLGMMALFTPLVVVQLVQNEILKVFVVILKNVKLSINMILV
jgi:hypothetical protein